MARTQKFRPEGNPDRIDALMQRRRSNAVGTHADRRQRRQRTRNAVRLACYRQVTA